MCVFVNTILDSFFTNFFSLVVVLMDLVLGAVALVVVCWNLR